MWLTDFLSVETWILLGTLVLLTKYYIRRKWSVLRNLNIPHDSPSLINFGNIKEAFSDMIFTYDLDHKKKYGSTWGLYIFFSPAIVSHDLAFLQQVMIKDFSTFPNRTSSSHLKTEELANSVLVTRDGQWRRIRKTLSPTFSTLKMKQMLHIVEWCVGNTLTVFKKRVENDNGFFTAKDVFSRLSLDVICSSAFSTDVNSQDESKQEPQISIKAKEMLSLAKRDFSYFISSLFPFLGPVLLRYSKGRSIFSFFRGVCKKMIQLKSSEAPDVQNRVDLLQLMLESKVDTPDSKKELKKGLTEIEIIGNSMVMLFAGFETTSTVMSFLAYNLAQYPDVQIKLQAEIDGMFEKTEGTLDYDNIHNLQYLDMCINESIRLYPPAPRTSRTNNEEITISGIKIPKNTSVIIPIHALCHDPEHWEEPMEFKPERMENMDEIHPMLFQPFGSGPRNCIGMRFALMEVKIAFCKILHQYTFKTTSNTPKPPLKLQMVVNTVRSKENFSLQVVPRFNIIDKK